MSFGGAMLRAAMKDRIKLGDSVTCTDPALRAYGEVGKVIATVEGSPNVIGFTVEWWPGYVADYRGSELRVMVCEA